MSMNEEELQRKLTEIAVRGVTLACADVEMRARAYAPVAKGRSPKGVAPSRVLLRPERSFKEKHTGPIIGDEGRRRTRGSRNLREIPTRERLEELQARGRLGTLRSVSKQGDFLRSFKMAEGPHKGKSPAVIRQLPGRTGIIGWAASSKETGHLRDSIHVKGVAVEGKKIVGTVRADADYAKAIELGFRHRGGRDKTGTTTPIPARPFMRKALQEVAKAYKSGKYFRSR